MNRTIDKSLAAQGYGIQSFGFEDHWVPLYTHKDLTDKKRGEMAFKARVGNPKAINQGEGYYLAKKGAQGFFPWRPDECLTHKFENVQYVKDKLGGTRVIRSEPMMGCQWCRAIKPEAVVEQPATAPAETVTAAATPVAEPPAVPTCDVCGWKSLKGNYLAVHKIKHRRTTAQAVPVQGSA